MSHGLVQIWSCFFSTSASFLFIILREGNDSPIIVWSLVIRDSSYFKVSFRWVWWLSVPPHCLSLPSPLRSQVHTGIKPTGVHVSDPESQSFDHLAVCFYENFCFCYFIPCVMLSLTFLLLEQFEWWGVLDWVASVAAQSIWSPACRKKLLLVMLTLVYCCLQFCAPNNAITTDSSSQHLYPSF